MATPTSPQPKIPFFRDPEYLPTYELECLNAEDESGPGTAAILKALEVAVGLEFDNVEVEHLSPECKAAFGLVDVIVSLGDRLNQLSERMDE